MYNIGPNAHCSCISEYYKYGNMSFFHGSFLCTVLYHHATVYTAYTHIRKLIQLYNYGNKPRPNILISKCLQLRIISDVVNNTGNLAFKGVCRYTTILVCRQCFAVLTSNLSDMQWFVTKGQTVSTQSVCLLS